ncbi:flagellar rod assembly protein/muramidase FlgJ [compost metagenome]
MTTVNTNRQVYKTQQTQPLNDPDRLKASQQGKSTPKPGTDTLSLKSGTNAVSSTSDVAAKARKAAAEHIGNAVVDGSRKLHSNGYIYPPNLTSNYYHKPGKVGCCADFVADSYAEAAKALNNPKLDIGARMKAMPAPMNNPHYCPSMIQFFQKEETLLKPNAKPQVGDVVFFDWDGNGAKDPDHVAIVSKVHADGTLELMESRKFNQPTEITTMKPGDSRYNNVVGFGRMKDATADNDAALQLEPLGSMPSRPGAFDTGAPPSGSRNPAAAAGVGHGRPATQPSGSPAPTVHSGKPSNYTPGGDDRQLAKEFMKSADWPPHLTESMMDFITKFFEKLRQSANMSDEDMESAISSELEKKGVPKEQASKLAKSMVKELKGNKEKIAKSPSGDTAKLMGKLSAEKIEKILADRGSPLAGKNIGEFVLQMEAKYGVPAAQFMAQATMESGLGKEGYTQGDHHNIGNLRPGSSWDGPTVSGSSGSFRSYGSWEEGIEDYFKLLSGPLYAGKSLQDQIFTYAPPSENDSSQYVDTVKQLISGWTGESL